MSRWITRVERTLGEDFTPIGSGTRVTERIGIEAPRPLLRLTVRKAVKAHTEMLAGSGDSSLQTP